MTDLSPSEFGGHTNHLGIPPFPHRPEAYEKLRAIYLTGDETGGEEGLYLPFDDEGAAFRGLLTEDEQRATREQEGALVKGEVWEEMEGG